MDIDKLTQKNILSEEEVLVTKFNNSANMGIGVKQFTASKTDMSPDTYVRTSMQLLSEVLKEIEFQNLVINEVGIQILEDVLHSVFKLVVVQNKHNLLIGGTISKKLVNDSGIKVYDYIATLNLMSDDEDSETGFTPDKLETVALITVPLNMLGGIDDFGDNVTFDILFKHN